MSDIDRDLLPEGLEDRLPKSAGAATQIVRAMLGVMDSHGYDRVRPPLIEFEKSLASRMDGVQPRKMFRFTDPVSLRMLALRSDMTVQVSRIAATGLSAVQRPLRLCYAGQVVTIKSDALDPRRERMQLGAELIGNDSAAAAAELVSMAIEAVKAAGCTGVSVDFTLPDLVDTLAAKALPLEPGQVDEVRRELDAKDAGGLKAAGGGAYLPLLYATGPFERAIEQLAAIDAGGALASRITALREIAARIGDAARLTLDPSERHGFEYQSWFGFTIYANGVRGALGRGGTYRIVGSDGAANEPAIGFSLYPDPLVDDAVCSGARPQAVFLPLGHDAAAAAQLRGQGKRTVAALAEADDAAALGCSHVLSGSEVKPVT